MELALGPLVDLPLAFRDIVSILVFVELALGPYPSKPLQLLDIWFQSLFLWNLPSDLSGRSYIMSPRRVSILVFVELALGPQSQQNPYLLPMLFQSLFLWNLPSDGLPFA